MKGADSQIGMIAKYCKCCDVPIERCEKIKRLFEIGAYELIPDFTEEREFEPCTILLSESERAS